MNAREIRTCKTRGQGSPPIAESDAFRTCRKRAQLLSYDLMFLWMSFPGLKRRCFNWVAGRRSAGQRRSDEVKSDEMVQSLATLTSVAARLLPAGDVLVVKFCFALHF